MVDWSAQTVDSDGLALAWASDGDRELERDGGLASIERRAVERQGC